MNKDMKLLLEESCKKIDPSLMIDDVNKIVHFINKNNKVDIGDLAVVFDKSFTSLRVQITSLVQSIAKGYKLSGSEKLELAKQIFVKILQDNVNKYIVDSLNNLDLTEDAKSNIYNSIVPLISLLLNEKLIEEGFDAIIDIAKKISKSRLFKSFKRKLCCH